MIHMQHALTTHFNVADKHYRKYHNGDALFTNDLSPDFDEELVVRHGRAWLILLTVRDQMNGDTDPGGPTFDELLDYAFTADFDDILGAMYG